MLERPFVVPAGTSQIDIDFSHDRRAEPIGFDLGVQAPGGSRGWSEDRTDHIHIDAMSASYGYVPGPIEPGLWTLQIGVAYTPDGPTPYRASIRLSGTLDHARPVLENRPGWYAGDLHTHSGHSDGYHTTAEGLRVPVPVQDLVAAAAAAGLDFLAITDHNTTSQWLEIDREQPADRGVLLLHGSEMTTYEGHFNTIGARRASDYRLGVQRPMRRVLEDAASDGAFLSINHPTLSNDDEWCTGCGWVQRDSDTIDGVRGVEVANGPTLGSDAPGWDWWAALSNAGHRLVAVGGSDTHDPALPGRRVGQPATVVYASALSEEAIVTGLKSGRVYIRTAGVDGPSIDLRGDGHGRQAVMGGALPAGRIRLIAAVAHARGQECVWIRRGREVGTASIETDRADLVFETDAAAGDWFTVIIRSGRRPSAFANAIYIDGRS